MIAGICFGGAISVVAFLARRKEDKWFHIIVIILIFAFVLFSSVNCGDGVHFIALVWDSIDGSDESILGIASFAICFSIEGLCHVASWVMSIRMKKSMHMKADLRASLSKENQPRMAASLIFEGLGKKSDSSKELRKQSIKDSSRVGSVNEGSEGFTGIADDEVNADVKATIDAVSLSSFSESEPLCEPKEDKDPEDPSESESEEPEASNMTDEDVLAYCSEKTKKDDGACEIPTCRQMFCSSWTCCGCARREHETWSKTVWSFLQCIVWWVLVVFSVSIVIVNLGSTTQQENARKELPYVSEALYSNINEGPVCAFDNKGEESNITTFRDREAAHAAGFLVLHCGACGACSDWDNLRQEYVTRKTLAKDSAACAKKSLFGRRKAGGRGAGGRGAVLECLKQAPISFQGKCAECWVDDILCTKGFCGFIYMQSLMINTFGDFQVENDMITSASCEEAHCEAGNPGDFVSCSGATRRRMNVTSSIHRPGAQLCGIVDVDWATLFPE
jgi:hypothetical protein